jgi:hypothetical protein
MIRTTLVLESRTNEKNFENKSMSFYEFDNIDSMMFTMGVKELVLVHVNNKTEEKRITVVDGTKFFNCLEYRTFNKKRIIVYRY